MTVGKKKKRKTYRRKKKQKVSWKWYVLVVLIVLFCAGRIASCFRYRPVEEVTLRYTNLTYNNYNDSSYLMQGNIMTYEDVNYTSRFGIDLSQHQKEVDWKAIKEAGAEFAMIRVGYRGYIHGDITEDEYFRENIRGAKQEGIQVGVYFFSEAITPEEAIEEAVWVIDVLKEYEIDFPVVYDQEYVDENPNARANGLDRDIRTENAVLFMENIKKAGYSPMIYASTNTYDDLYDTEALTKYPFWVAQYNSICTYPYEYVMWQYGQAEGIPGIKDGIDLNVLLVPKHIPVQ